MSDYSVPSCLTDAENGVTLDELHIDNLLEKSPQKSINYVDIVSVVLFFAGFCLFYCFYEGWSLMDAVYFILVSISTVGNNFFS
jgi:hypothetical protein